VAKQSGLGDRLLVGGYDLSGDVGAVGTIRGTVAPLDVTSLNKEAVERIGGIRDGEISFNAWHDTATDSSHAVLSTLPTADRIVEYLRGTGRGNAAAGLVAKQIGYDSSRGTDGSLAYTVQALGSGYGLEWGTQLTAGLETIAGAASTVTVDDLGGTPVSTAFGAAAYLQVESIGSGTATVVVQDSADDVSFATVAGLAFTPVTGRTAERVATASGATVRRYLHVTVTGTFTNLVASVVIVRYRS
jgi:hypothetical protein